LITTAFQLCFRIYQWEGSSISGGVEIEWDVSADVNLLGEKIHTTV